MCFVFYFKTETQGDRKIREIFEKKGKKLQKVRGYCFTMSSRLSHKLISLTLAVINHPCVPVKKAWIIKHHEKKKKQTRNKTARTQQTTFFPTVLGRKSQLIKCLVLSSVVAKMFHLILELRKMSQTFCKFKEK